MKRAYNAPHSRAMQVTIALGRLIIEYAATTQSLYPLVDGTDVARTVAALDLRDRNVQALEAAACTGGDLVQYVEKALDLYVPPSSDLYDLARRQLRALRLALGIRPPVAQDAPRVVELHDDLVMYQLVQHRRWWHLRDKYAPPEAVSVAVWEQADVPTRSQILDELATM